VNGHEKKFLDNWWILNFLLMTQNPGSSWNEETGRCLLFKAIVSIQIS
jgi:hypothetical protein